MPVRNEAWCLGLTLRAALLWCDEMVVFQHACTDGTQQIIWDVEEEHPGRIINLVSSLTDWHEMAQRQTMLEKAREFAATHIAIVDADEILTGNLLPSKTALNTINTYLNAIKPGECLQLPMYQLRGSLDRYHSNGIWGNRWLSVAFQDDPRLSWSGDKFHSREPEYPGGGKLRPYQPIKHGQGGSFHLWGVSERRLKAKHALYKVTERLRWPAKSIVAIDQQYNLWRSPGDCRGSYISAPEWALEWTFADVPAEWWQPYMGLGGANFIKHLDPPCPDDGCWQEIEVRRLVAERGAETFKGLDLFGVV
jgi:hypothetical protein